MPDSYTVFSVDKTIFYMENMMGTIISNNYPFTETEYPMELRVLQYFLAVTREQSISGAAETLHLSQPTLSRQLKE